VIKITLIRLVFEHSVGPDEAQLACMKQVPGATLEDAVVKTDSYFWPFADS
jgi:hypothetical protein